MAELRFEWDTEKARSNLRKHGVSFETAVRVFSDPFALVEQDRVEDGEYRWQPDHFRAARHAGRKKTLCAKSFDIILIRQIRLR
ncbi:BrnT family toxin [Mesorhizobium sp.]|uniref:BrnT family toxin n=1 Tax=Mesorhizobium sp. TaxID=1871066 RepID=UPI002681E2CD